MKKIYQNPEIKIVKIQTQQMMAGSEQMGFGTPTEDAGEAESRKYRGSLWDEEEEEYQPSDMR